MTTKKALPLSFLVTISFLNCTAHTSEQYNQMELFVKKFKTQDSITPTLPTRATGAQAIAGFGAVLQRIAPLLPPPQAAIIEAMSMAVAVVAGCVDADEKHQEYLDFLRWKEQQKSFEFPAETQTKQQLVTYAILASSAIYQNLFKQQQDKIRAHLMQIYPQASTTLAQTESSAFMLLASQTFEQGITILKALEQSENHCS